MEVWRCNAILLRVAIIGEQIPFLFDHYFIACVYFIFITMLFVVHFLFVLAMICFIIALFIKECC